MSGDVRQKQITKTSIVGILTNIGLVAMKGVIGLIAGSVAIILDAVNNLTDALSSVVTVIGIRLAKRRPDKKHPFGHGRIEYFSAVIVAAIVLVAGVTSLIESVKKIIAPEVPDYSVITVVLIAVAVVVKIVLGLYFKRQGTKYNSDALVASGADALFDAIVSSATIVGIVVMLIFGVSIDGYVGAFISLFIIKAGIEMLLKPVNQMLGGRADSETTKAIRKTVEGFDGVEGAYDLILHNYGPDCAIGSVHVEIPAETTAEQIHVLTRNIQQTVLKEFHVFLTVGIYAVDEQSEEKRKIGKTIRKIAEKEQGILNVHGIFVDESAKTVSFDVVVDFTVKDRNMLCKNIVETMKENFPEYTVTVNFDGDYSD